MGLTAQHGQAHFVRAVMEGVLFNLKLIAESLEAVQPLSKFHAGVGFFQQSPDGYKCWPIFFKSRLAG